MFDYNELFHFVDPKDPKEGDASTENEWDDPSITDDGNDGS